jgi:hypothetical protein
MDTKPSVENHLKAFEHDLQAALVPLGEIANQSRVYAEKTFSAMREETIDLLHKLHAHNGDALADCTSTRDLASIAAAQERWLMGFGRDWYEATIRIGEASRAFFADSLESAAAAMRNGHGRSALADTVADETEEAADDAVETVDHAVAHSHED